MSKAKLTAAEWELVKDAPYWVEQALASPNGGVEVVEAVVRRDDRRDLDRRIRALAP